MKVKIRNIIIMLIISMLVIFSLSGCTNNSNTREINIAIQMGHSIRTFRDHERTWNCWKNASMVFRLIGYRSMARQLFAKEYYPVISISDLWVLHHS